MTCHQKASRQNHWEELAHLIQGKVLQFWTGQQCKEVEIFRDHRVNRSKLQTYLCKPVAYHTCWHRPSSLLTTNVTNVFTNRNSHEWSKDHSRDSSSSPQGGSANSHPEGFLGQSPLTHAQAPEHGADIWP